MAPAATKAAASSVGQLATPLADALLGASNGQPGGEGVNHPPAVLEVPSFLAGSYALEVPRKVVAPLGAADEALKHLWSILRDVGLFVELGFKV